MARLSLRQSVELFHLAFLRGLVAKGEDKALIALKGGCNLRFYFGSIRYSEDIDFDVGVMAPGTLRNKVERLLKSPIVAAPLKTNGIEIAEFSSPKQTDTTQRWKVGLRASWLDVPVRTKVEFSRRDAIDGAAFEAIDREVLRAHGLTPSLSTHYTLGAAIRQKIQALAGRVQPQARDVFDLNLLFSRSDAKAVLTSIGHESSAGAAIDNAMGISFDEYTSKVVAFLDPAQVSPHEDRAAWNIMQEAVVAELEALR